MMVNSEAAESRRARPADCEWKTIEGVKIPAPPKEHPRLYLRARDLDGFKRRYGHPSIQKLIRSVTDDPERILSNRPSHSGKDPVNLDRYMLNADLLKYMAEGGNADTARDLLRCGLRMLRRCPRRRGYKGGKTAFSRQAGRLITTAAAAYDWCYPHLTETMKTEYFEAFMKIIRQMEIRWPPKGGSVVGHSCEMGLQRDILSVGVAIYDEHPEIYEIAAKRIFDLFVPVRNWFFPHGAHHQGSGYVNARFGAAVYTQLIFERMGAGLIYKDMDKVHYHYIQKLLPDGRIMADGDVHRYRGKPGEKPRAHDSVRFLAALYQDGYLAKRSERFSRPDFFFNALFADPFLESKDYDDLPLSRYSGGPFGRMVARTGWGWDAVVCEMRVSEYYFGNHQHLDGGQFQIYYKGSLAADTGIYGGVHGTYWSDHNKNWAWRTVAHNSLTVYDPDEKLVDGYDPDGGQWVWAGQNRIAVPKHMDDLLRHFHIAHVLGYGFGPDRQRPDYSYLRGDLTRGYGKKVKSFQRAFVFLNLKGQDIPAALIVYDDVVAARPELKKTWLLHSHAKPKIAASRATIDRVIEGECNGRLVLETLLPREVEIEKIGGPGKEFWRHGKNYVQAYPKSQANADRAEYGGWRVEVSPRDAAEHDEFLSVMQITDADNDRRLAVTPILTRELAGVAIADRVVLIARGAKPLAGPVQFEVDGDAKVLVTGLAPGRWTVETPAGTKVMEAPHDSGAIYFDAKAGSCRLLTTP